MLCESVGEPMSAVHLSTPGGYFRCVQRHTYRCICSVILGKIVHYCPGMFMSRGAISVEFQSSVQNVWSSSFSCIFPSCPIPAPKHSVLWPLSLRLRPSQKCQRCLSEKPSGASFSYKMSPSTLPCALDLSGQRPHWIEYPVEDHHSQL